MHVPYELKITQVTDGMQYKGHIRLNKSTLLYEITFSIPIPRMDAEMPEDPGGVQGLRKLFPIVLRKEDKTIDLSDDEYGIFLRILLEEVVGFHDLGQTRDANREGGVAQMVAMLGGSAEISVVLDGAYDLPQDVLDILNGPKFGCDLMAA